MQRGWNSSNGQLDSQIEAARTNPQIGLKGASIGQPNKDGSIKTLGGDPVNITNLLLGAKQQTTTEQINVGSITIVDDDGKYMMDRKDLLSSNNNGARRFFHQSRNDNATVISDFSNLQTKQLGILRNHPRIKSRGNSGDLYHARGKSQEEWESDKIIEKRVQN